MGTTSRDNSSRAGVAGREPLGLLYLVEDDVEAVSDDRGLPLVELQELWIATFSSPAFQGRNWDLVALGRVFARE